MAAWKIASGEFWLTLRLVVSALGRKHLFLPFLLYACAQLLTVIVLTVFHAPGVSPVGEPLVRLLGGEAATHYPQFYIALPSLMEKAFVVLHILLGSLLMGAATVMLWMYFVRRSCGLREALVKARGRYAQLLGIALVADVLVVTLSTLAYRVASGGNAGILAAPFVGRGFALFVAFSVQALLAYALPSLMISETGFVGALRRSVQVAGKNPVMTFLLVAFAFVPHVPLRYLTSKSVFMVERLRPELVAWLVGLDVLVGVVTGLFLVAGITRLYLFAMREE